MGNCLRDDPYASISAVHTLIASSVDTKRHSKTRVSNKLNYNRANPSAIPIVGKQQTNGSLLGRTVNITQIDTAAMIAPTRQIDTQLLHIEMDRMTLLCVPTYI